MSIGDFVVLEGSSSNGGRGSRTYNTAYQLQALQPSTQVNPSYGHLELLV